MVFISIEGCEGSGKTTQAKILREALKRLGKKVIVTKEPGGSPFGEMLRGILLSNEINDSMTEFLLLSAARRDHIIEIKRFLNEGNIVITDRFSDSSIAYQGYAKGLDLEKIELITELITEGFMPQLTILLDVSLDIMQQRIKSSGDHNTFYDQKGMEFHKKVKNGFLQIAERYPQRIIVINGDKSIDEVSEDILKSVARLFVESEKLS